MVVGMKAVAEVGTEVGIEVGRGVVMGLGYRLV